MRRRRVASARTYSISYLLSRQPRSLHKRDLYEAMLRQFSLSSRLQQLRFDRRCYSLLHHARIAPHNLHHFYRTYRLPEDPFFPLFLAVKRDYLDHRERLKQQRELYAMERMRALPQPILSTIRYLGYLECHYNARGDSPVWQKNLFPGSKRKADGYGLHDHSAWIAIFRGHMLLLRARYRGISRAVAERVIACSLLEITPETIPPPRPTPDQINRNYRKLSLIHHPDRGGDPALFIEIKRARDALMG